MVFGRGFHLSAYATFGHLKRRKMNGKTALSVGVPLLSNMEREAVVRDPSARIA
jgi:hypothetical protein